MRTTSIRDLHIRTSELVREASDGTVIVIQRRGEPIAELRPISKKARKSPLPGMSAVWKSFPLVATDSGRFLEEDR